MPVGRCAFEHDAAVASDERREGVEFERGSEARGHDLFGVDDRRQVKPSHQKEREHLRRVAYEDSERGDEPGAAERQQQLRHKQDWQPQNRRVQLSTYDERREHKRDRAEQLAREARQRVLHTLCFPVDPYVAPWFDGRGCQALPCACLRKEFVCDSA